MILCNRPRVQELLCKDLHAWQAAGLSPPSSPST